MAKLSDLKKYLNYEFSTGSYTGEDYKSFQTKYINYLKAMCKDNHWRLAKVGKNHYCFSAFIVSAQNKYVYISISDVGTSRTNGTAISSSARQKTNRTTEAVSITIRRLKICRIKPQGC